MAGIWETDVYRYYTEPSYARPRKIVDKGLGFAVASPTEITIYVVGSSMAEHRIVVPAVQVRFLSFHPNLSTYPRGLRRQVATLLFAGSVSECKL